MPERKQTPDVLGEILGEVANAGSPVAEAPVRRAPARHPAQPAGAPNSELKTPNSKLICWDHRIVSFQNYRGWRPRYVDGVEAAEWMAGPLLQDYLNEMGAQGWEVAGAASGHPLYGSADAYQVIFKRPKR